jgi:MFS family permease
MNTSMPALAASARRITHTLFASQSLVSAAIISGTSINAILGAELGGDARWAGVPTAVFLLTGAFSSLGWGYLMEAIGRRRGLAIGLMIGVLGSALACFAVVEHTLPAYLAGLALLGAANSAMQLSRFSAGEVHPPAERGRAISTVVLASTVGAIVGPLLVGPAGRLAQQAGVDELAGPLAVGALLLLFAVGVAWTWLRPDPRDLALKVAALYPAETIEDARERPLAAILRQPPVRAAMLSMATAQVVMVAVMVITSLHMRHEHHGLGSISAVISAHTIGMFAFSLVSGRLVDRWGRTPVIATGAVVLVLACLAAPLSPQVLPLAVALFLLGLGWNFCYVGSSTLLADQLLPAERSRVQGVNDWVVGLSAAAASVSSGLIFAAVGYTVMALLGAALALVPLVVLAAWRRRRRGDALAIPLPEVVLPPAPE